MSTPASTEPAASSQEGGPSSAPTDQLGEFIGRDPSLLAFNRRVLAQAGDATHPLLERVKFLTIVASNLDEFFMKRIARHKRRQAAGLQHRTHDGRSLAQNLAELRDLVRDLQDSAADCLASQLVPALAEQGVHLTDYNDLSAQDQARLQEWFHSNVFPILTPLAVDPGHRFPFISNLSENLGVTLRTPGSGDRVFARLKIPDGIPRLAALCPEGEVGVISDPHNVRFVPLEQIVMHNLDDVFPGMQVEEVMPFRVTRSTGVEAEEEEFENLLQHVEDEVRQRRFAEAVRLETPSDASPAMLELLVEELELDADSVYSRSGPLEYADLDELYKLDRPDLKQDTWVSVIPARLRPEDTDIFSVIRERDIFVHHPYESFQKSVEWFIAAAASDPNVLAIKQTLYRTSRDSPFISSLIRAAEDGKAIACMVELRARFDEDKNVRFARQLEKHGVHVAYGMIGLKTHCKCSLVVRREGDGLRSYVHIGTGNYHPGTAQLYTDCGLLTCDPAITTEVVNLFNYLTGRSMNRHYDSLIVAPSAMRRKMYDLIDREIEFARAGKPAQIFAKMNQLEDVGIIRKLYEASNAGVEITLIVRGFCCLRPGVPGMSENIRVLSIVGRFLEHSRIFFFGAGREDPLDGEWFIGSADWMSRNLNDRVEVACPVTDRDARARLQRIREVGLADRLRAWELRPDGSYVRLQPDAGADPDSPSLLGTFETMCRDALATRPRA